MSDLVPSTHNYLSTDRGQHLPYTAVVSSFEEFLFHVQTEVGMPTDTSVESTEGVMEYLMDASSSIGKLPKGTLEGTLQKESFGYLKKLGCRALENTSDQVNSFNSVVPVESKKPETVETKKTKKTMTNTAPEMKFESSNEGYHFRKLSCAHVSQTSKRVDLTIRLSHTDDRDVLKVEQQSTVAPACRLAPWNIVSFIEFKKLNENLLDNEYVSQCAEYCSNLLKICPGRSFVMCALTNFLEIVFVAAFLKESSDGIVTSVQFVRSEIVNEPEESTERSTERWCQQMYQYICTSRNALGFRCVIPEYLESKLFAGLGRGAYSATVQLTNHDYQVLKVSRFAAALANEVRVLRDIRSRLSSNMLDRLPECFQLSDPSPFMVFQQHKFNKSEYDVTPAIVKRLWPLVREIHATGYVHRDIRSANIMKNASGEYSLIDFSSAHKPDGQPFGDASIDIPPGAMRIASPPVFDAYLSMPSTLSPYKRGNYICHFEDEVYSLIAIVVQHHPSAKRLYPLDWIPRNSTEVRQKLQLALKKIDVNVSENEAGEVAKCVRQLEEGRGTLEASDRERILMRAMDILMSSYPAKTAATKSKK